MSHAKQKTIQYLNEAHASEQALTRVLQTQIAVTPRGSFRKALESHLRETRQHADRIQARISELGGDDNPLERGIGLIESAFEQVIAVGKVPLDLMRGSGGEEKLLKNAKDAYAAEALEIATYTAIERFARALGDTRTADLAASILADEQKMLDRLLREIPKLTDAVFEAEIDDQSTYEVSTTGAADAARSAGRSIREGAGRTSAGVKRTARQARKVPGVAQAEGQIKGALASESDLPISSYGSLTAAEITERLTDLSQIDLAKVDSYERKNENRSTVLSRIAALRTSEPWPGYDELTVSEVRAALDTADDARVRGVRSYERAHKDRAGVLEAADRELAHVS